MNAETSTNGEARSFADRAFLLYQRSACGILLLLCGVTWPLWIPTDRFPTVPVAELLCPVPAAVDLMLLGLVVLSSTALFLLGPKNAWSTKLWLSLAVALTGCFLLNQHRFQPWAYQMAVLAIFFGLAPPTTARRLTIWLTLSIYFYSALSKLNPSFVNELGTDFLQTFGTFVGMTWDAEALVTWKWLALVFPLFEFATFLLLLSARTRRVGVIAACLMHLGLLLVLGPLGLSHSWGVLQWNLFFIVQVVLLFWFSPEQAAAPHDAAAASRTSWLAQTVCILVLLFPVLELIGLGDPWPAWVLYASHVGRSHLFLPRHTVGRLPPELQKYVAAEPGDELYVPVKLDRWSLDTTGAPIYPGSRFAFAVGRAFVTKTGTGNFARFVIESPAGRFRGERDSEAIAGARMAQEADRRFWLNTRPRDFYLPGGR